ncbi:MAG TPA: DUF3467 domain-containing protein [Vicinamibacterales bacterium]
MAETRAINFTIVPDDRGAPDRVYANFCAIAQTPFDVTLSFCEVLPLNDEQIRQLNESPTREVRVSAPVRARVVLPFQVVQTLVAALQEHLRASGSGPGASAPVH